mgnify:CR=1 FL=1
MEQEEKKANRAVIQFMESLYFGVFEHLQEIDEVIEVAKVFAKEIKELLGKFGAVKLSAVKPEDLVRLQLLLYLIMHAIFQKYTEVVLSLFQKGSMKLVRFLE